MDANAFIDSAHQIGKVFVTVKNHNYKMKLDVKHRIDWIDQARGILFLCVILIHSQLSPDVIGYLYKPVFLTGFFFLSGYLYKDKPLKDKIIAVFNGLFVPFVLYSIIGGAIAAIESSSAKVGINILLTNLGGGDFVWFIPCLVIVEIFYLMLRQYMRGKTDIVCMVFSIMAIFITANIGLQRGFWSWEVSLFAIGFFAFGDFCKKRLLSFKYAIILSALYLFFAIVCGSWGLLNGIDMHLNKYGSTVVFIPLAAIGCISFVSLIRFVPTTKIIVEFGRYTLFMFPFHYMIMMHTMNCVHKLGVTNGKAWGISSLLLTFVFLLFISRYIYKFVPALGGKKKWIK